MDTISTSKPMVCTVKIEQQKTQGVSVSAPVTTSISTKGPTPVQSQSPTDVDTKLKLKNISKPAQSKSKFVDGSLLSTHAMFYLKTMAYYNKAIIPSMALIREVERDLLSCDDTTFLNVIVCTLNDSTNKPLFELVISLVSVFNTGTVKCEACPMRRFCYDGNGAILDYYEIGDGAAVDRQAFRSIGGFKLIMCMSVIDRLFDIRGTYVANLRALDSKLSDMRKSYNELLSSKDTEIRSLHKELDKAHRDLEVAEKSASDARLDKVGSKFSIETNAPSMSVPSPYTHSGLLSSLDETDDDATD